MKTTKQDLYSNKVKDYNNSPNYCKYCDSAILHLSTGSLFHTKAKKFCNQSCSASFNNKFPRTRMGKQQEKTYKCRRCGDVIVVPRGNLSKFPEKISCPACIELNNIDMDLRTKGEVFAGLSNWQSARSTIRKHSAKVMQSLGRLKFCQICGYSNHVEICHIKSVSSFPETARFNEINSPNNLVYLCPNHHWEFDNGYLKL